MRVFSPLVFAASAACAQPLLVQDSPVMRVLTTDNDYGLNQYEAFGVPVDEADFEDGENDFNHGENDYDGRNGNLHYDVAEGGQDDADFADFSPRAGVTSGSGLQRMEIKAMSTLVEPRADLSNFAVELVVQRPEESSLAVELVVQRPEKSSLAIELVVPKPEENFALERLE
ncbi:hypothetical protein H310_03534 [Aphanomyces invadans]|uniref:Uncharacterized protein n=1 Tax=Aphanomyces invadans TaxID=157072 RepID=A0A024UJ52_9STRA|nr:hypothetical protein H310_03534 [Aphanomyces invadans]ETW05877.1 hypothetical protein H310_03534 [Aphanomyces invadans]|eukprot:XP_008865654.1 hypothetical protein H310_03534 [Aphanomyces invadans]